MCAAVAFGGVHDPHAFFPWPHAADVLLTLALMSRVGASAILVWGVGVPSVGRTDCVLQVFGAASIGVLARTLLWNPDYDFDFDWDIFAISGFVVSPWLGLLAASRTPMSERGRVAAVWLLTVLAVTGPWIVGRAYGVA